MSQQVLHPDRCKRGVHSASQALLRTELPDVGLRIRQHTSAYVSIHRSKEILFTSKEILFTSQALLRAELPDVGLPTPPRSAGLRPHTVVQKDTSSSRPHTLVAQGLIL